MTDGPLTRGQIEQYSADGYLIVPKLFSEEEMSLLIRKSRGDGDLQSKAWNRLDSKGRSSRITLWNQPRDDLYGMFSRCNRLVDAVEQILGGEVYHWHSKMMLKEPKVGGAWEWHQDYGYWYNDAVLTPDLLSCMIAVDRATKENGCLQVLKGSHQMGRVEHGQTGDQTGADSARVEEAKKRYELVYVELEPGDTLFFHSNLLHSSAPNTSENPRWSLICCYNRADNAPFAEKTQRPYIPLDKVPDSAVLEVGRAELASA